MLVEQVGTVTIVTARESNAMTVRTALALINQTLDEVLAEQEAEFDPDTRWALAWFDQHGMEEGEFGLAETLSRAKNTAYNSLVLAWPELTRLATPQAEKMMQRDLEY